MTDLDDHERRIARLEELVFRLSKVLNLAGSLLRISNVIELMTRQEGEKK